MYAYFIVNLKKDGKIIGTGMVMPDAKTVHGYQLTKGWACVAIKHLKISHVPCWEEYPTHSDEIEVGSFSAWPADQLMTPGGSGTVMCHS
jgi:hypothetical protein